jgi:hypothetical protein
MEEMTVRMETRAATTASRIASWSAIIGGVVVATLLAGVGVAAILARQGGSEEWRTWSDVGQTFGVLSSIISSLALLAVVITARQNRNELEHQRQFLIHNHAELRRTSHANLGMLHQQLLKMSIEDEELAAVWPALDPDASASVNRQLLYANLIYAYHIRALESDNHSDATVVGSMRYLFSNPIMRDYWHAARTARDQLDPKCAEAVFGRQIDKICTEYENVLARSGKKSATGPTLVPDRSDPAHAA